jgi:phosphatidylglycerol lysyltransferase
MEIPMRQAQNPSELMPSLSTRLAPYLLPLVSLGLFVAALWGIHHLLAEISYVRLLEEIATFSTQQIGLALLFTAGSFAALMGYDWSALSYIGHRLPGLTVAFASFCGYAFSNTLGLSLLSGGSVRYRVYASKGLDAADIARVTLFNMLAFGIGVHIVGAAALTLQPDLLAGLFGISAFYLRGIGVFVLACGAGAVVWTFYRKTPLKIASWSFRLPGVHITLFQLDFGLFHGSREHSRSTIAGC